MYNFFFLPPSFLSPPFSFRQHDQYAVVSHLQQNQQWGCITDLVLEDAVSFAFLAYPAQFPSSQKYVLQFLKGFI